MGIIDVIYGIAIIITAGYVAREKIREIKLTRRHGIKANPERCAIHQIKIQSLQQEISELKAENNREHEKIHQLLGDLRERLSRLEAKINSRRK